MRRISWSDHVQPILLITRCIFPENESDWTLMFISLFFLFYSQSQRAKAHVIFIPNLLRMKNFKENRQPWQILLRSLRSNQNLLGDYGKCLTLQFPKFFMTYSFLPQYGSKPSLSFGILCNIHVIERNLAKLTSWILNANLFNCYFL